MVNNISRLRRALCFLGIRFLIHVARLSPASISVNMNSNADDHSRQSAATRFEGLDNDELRKRYAPLLHHWQSSKHWTLRENANNGTIVNFYSTAMYMYFMAPLHHEHSFTRVFSPSMLGDRVSLLLRAPWSVSWIRSGWFFPTRHFKHWFWLSILHFFLLYMSYY